MKKNYTKPDYKRDITQVKTDLTAYKQTVTAQIVDEVEVLRAEVIENFEPKRPPAAPPGILFDNATMSGSFAVAKKEDLYNNVMEELRGIDELLAEDHKYGAEGYLRALEREQITLFVHNTVARPVLLETWPNFQMRGK